MQGFNPNQYQQPVGAPNPFMAHGRVGQFGPPQSPGWPQQTNPFRLNVAPGQAIPGGQQMPQQMPYAMPQQMPYAMPQQMPYAMPQQAPVGGLTQMYNANLSSPTLGGVSPNMGQPVQQLPAGGLAQLQNELLAQKTAPSMQSPMVSSPQMQTMQVPLSGVPQMQGPDLTPYNQ